MVGWMHSNSPAWLLPVMLAAVGIVGCYAYTAGGGVDFKVPSMAEAESIPFGNATIAEGTPEEVELARTVHKLALLREEAEWKNTVVLGWLLPHHVRAELPLWILSWNRNFLAGLLMYFAVSGLWCGACYGLFGSYFYKPGEIPSFHDIKLQMLVSLQAMPFYTALPTLTEQMVLWNWTRAYPRISDYGIFNYLTQVIVYMTFVEFGVYWAHRSLHELKWGYKHLHSVHHVYNKNNTLSPFAGLAFHPVDGILQALSYTIGLFFVPFHFLTHEFFLFATSVWTTNIHDCIDGKCEPIMGAGYHTIHHTDYKTNYGHYFIYMDKLFGTLLPPDEYYVGKRAKAN